MHNRSDAELHGDRAFVSDNSSHPAKNHVIPGTLVIPEHLRQIPFRLELRVPLSRFTLRDLQQLKAGALLATEHLSVRDLVLTAAGERLLLVELEAIEQQLAARVKRLAWRHKWRRKA